MLTLYLALKLPSYSLLIFLLIKELKSYYKFAQNVIRTVIYSYCIDIFNLGLFIVLAFFIAYNIFSRYVSP